MTRLSAPIRVLVGMAVLVGGVLAIYALLRPPDPQVSPTRPQPLAFFSENGVTVEIRLEKDAQRHTWLVGTLSPQQAQFHLYSKDLPRAGIRGLGRPTLLEIIAPAEVKPIGKLLANQPTQQYYSRAIDQSLPIYPAGPVTLRLPIELPPGSDSTPTELSVTYMACSADTCLTPVEDKRVAVVIPGVARQ